MTGESNYRRMSFSVVFAGLAVAVGLSALTANSGISKVILIWIAANALTISVAYSDQASRCLGDGCKSRPFRSINCID